MRHEMRLAKEPFEKIKNGTKVIESRLFDDKRKLIKPGDEIIFRLADDASQEVLTRVTTIYRYDTFKELMTNFPAALFGGTSTEELLTDIRRFYSEDEEQKFSVVGIRIDPIQ